MDLDLPHDLQAYLVELDDFIGREIKPLEEQGDNVRFFDHRREDSRTDWHRGGLPSIEWEELLAEARRRADAAGHYRHIRAGAGEGERDGSADTARSSGDDGAFSLETKPRQGVDGCWVHAPG